MLFLSVVTALIFSGSAKNNHASVEKLFKQYVQNVSSNKVSHDVFTKDFVNIMNDDQIIFAPCSKNKCKVKVKVTTPKHNKDIRKIETQVSYKKDKKVYKISSRQGCYFVIKDKGSFKLDTYLEDCHAH